MVAHTSFVMVFPWKIPILDPKFDSSTKNNYKDTIYCIPICLKETTQSGLGRYFLPRQEGGVGLKEFFKIHRTSFMEESRAWVHEGIWANGTLITRILLTSKLTQGDSTGVICNQQDGITTCFKLGYAQQLRWKGVGRRKISTIFGIPYKPSKIEITSQPVFGHVEHWNHL